MADEDASKMVKHGETVRVHIDQKQHESPNPTTGEALYRLGQVKAGLELFREVAGDREDPWIENGPETVHLRQDEHFHSGPPKEITIIVNATPKEVEQRKFTFDQIVKLAYEVPPFGENTLFRVTYRRGKGEKEHTLDEGHSVKVTERMIFDVTPTDRS